MDDPTRKDVPVPTTVGSSTRGRRAGRPRLGSPFATALPGIAVALAYALATAAWVVAGDRLPGGRWLAVHLFTLGVLTNLVLTFSEHFARTVTRAPGEPGRWWPVATNLGVLAVLVGLPADRPWLLAAGGTVLIGVVLAGYVRLRRLRRRSLGARFAWIVRAYERAHGAFLHGALLGVLLGAGLVPGGWYAGFRAAHQHANVLGWGGITLLATLVFFGPTMARTRIEPGADARAARVVRLGATGLGLGVLLLLASSAPGALATPARLAAAASIGLLAWAVTVVCLPVARAALAARPTGPRWLVMGVCAWFPLVVWADVALIATAGWRWLDALGLAALTGVLAQAMLATLTYLAPMLRGRTNDEREVVRRRLEAGARTRATAFQAGVALVVVAALGVLDAPAAATAGWGLVGAALATTALAVAWPLRPRAAAASSPPAD